MTFTTFITIVSLYILSYLFTYGLILGSIRASYEEELKSMTKREIENILNLILQGSFLSVFACIACLVITRKSNAKLGFGFSIEKKIKNIVE